MKITKSRLIQIIKEELESASAEEELLNYAMENSSPGIQSEMKEEIGRLANKVRGGGDINVAKGKVDMLIGLHAEGK